MECILALELPTDLLACSTSPSKFENAVTMMEYLGRPQGTHRTD